MIRFRILVAMHSELTCLPRRLQAHAICHGIGADRARHGVRQAIESKPDLLICFGVAGALSHSLSCGDLLCPEQLVHPDSSDPLTTLGSCQQAKPGRLLSWPQVVTDPAMKSELASRYDAVAVDNESASIAMHASQSGIPCLVLRSISDDLTTRVPVQVLTCLDPYGRPRMPALAGALWRKPAMVTDLVRLGRQFGKAQQTLRQAGRQLDLWLHDQAPQGWSHLPREVRQ